MKKIKKFSFIFYILFFVGFVSQSSDNSNSIIPDTDVSGIRGRKIGEKIGEGIGDIVDSGEAGKELGGELGDKIEDAFKITRILIKYNSEGKFLVDKKIEFNSELVKDLKGKGFTWGFSRNR